MTLSARRNVRLLSRVLPGALLGLLAVCVLAAAGEAGFRVWARLRGGQWPATRKVALHDTARLLGKIYRRHPYLNVAPKEGGSASAAGKSVHISSLGYRSPERPLAKPPGVQRALLSGGSTTFDVLARDDESTWPYALERTLRESAVPVEVWNAGFPGWTSEENLISLETRDLDLQPDVVVLFQGINDLQPATHRPFDRGYESGHAELAGRAAGFELGAPTLFDRSLLLERIHDSFSRPATRWLLLMHPAAHGPRSAGASDAGLQTFGRNVRSLVALAEDRGVRTVLVTQTLRLRAAEREGDLDILAGWFPDLDPAQAPQALEPLNDVLRAVAAQTGSVLVDAARQVPWEDGDFGDPMHYTDSGRRKLVGLLAPALRELLAASAAAPDLKPPPP